MREINEDFFHGFVFLLHQMGDFFPTLPNGGFFPGGFFQRTPCMAYGLNVRGSVAVSLTYVEVRVL
jgi:hypothetical protein